MARGNRNMRGAGAGALRAGAAAGSVTATSIVTIEQITAETFAGFEYDPSANGQVMTLNHAGGALVGSNIGGVRVGRFGMQGLDGVDAVSTNPDGTVTVRFSNGTECTVDLRSHTVTSNAAGAPNAEAMAAIFHALATKAESDPAYAELRDALAVYGQDRSNLAALALAAHSGEKALGFGDGFRVVPVEADMPTAAAERCAQVFDAVNSGAPMPKWMPQSAAGSNPIAMAMYPNKAAIRAEAMNITVDDWDVQDMASAFNDLAEELNDPDIAARLSELDLNDKNAFAKAAEELAQELDFGTPAPSVIAARMKTLREIPGLRMYKANPNYKVTPELNEMAMIVSNAALAGTRSYGLQGPPGTGKNAFINEMAAAARMPVFEVDMAGGDSIRDLIGDVGLQDGNTVQRIGPMARAMCAPGGCTVVMNEWVSMPSAEQTALHNILGSGATQDQHGDRFITFKNAESAEDTTMFIDPETRIYLTWNPGRGDEAPNPAIMRRMTVLSMEPGDEVSETEKLMHMMSPSLTRIMDSREMEGDERAPWEFNAGQTRVNDQGYEEVVPYHEQCPDLASEATKMTRFGIFLRDMYYQGETEHFPTPGVLQRALTQIIREKHLVTKGDDIPVLNGVGFAAKTFDYLLPQSVPPAEREDKMREWMSSFWGQEIADLNGIS